MIIETLNSIHSASQNGNASMVKLFLADKNIKASKELDYTIVRAANNGHYEVVELLLNDERINPTIQNNNAIICAYNSEHKKTLKLLWNDTRVKATLKKDFIELYDELIKDDIKANIKKKVSEF